MDRLDKLRQYINERGLLWTSLYVIRLIGTKIIHRLDMYIIRIEKRKFLTGPSTVSSRYNTIEENIRLWTNYDWSQFGEEWTLDVKQAKGLDPNRWKTSLINEMMLKYIKKGSTVLEIGPGAGRWTEILQPICTRLLIADISEKCLSICRERFKSYGNIEYYLIEEGGLNFIPDNTIDYIWSYDVFVHINPTDIERYIVDFGRILKPGGVAIIHHSGTYASKEVAKEVAKRGFRSYIDGKFFSHLVKKHGMRSIEQNDSLPHVPGDLISVFMKLFQ